MPHGAELAENLGIDVGQIQRRDLRAPATLALAVSAVAAEVIQVAVLPDKRMLPHLAHGDADLGLNLQNSVDEIFCVRAERAGHCVDALLGLGQHQAHIIFVKR